MKYSIIFGMIMFCFLIMISLSSLSAGSKNLDTLRVAYFGKDVPAIEPLSPSFDPDSYAVIVQIFDSLLFIDLDGKFQPALAVKWRQLNEKLWEFNLRKNVTFHNGEPFDGNAVKFTYEYAIDPKNNAGNFWILSIIKSVEVDPKNPFRVLIHLQHPDGMFLNRLNMFGSIVPPNYIKEKGFKYFSQYPVGTGPYIFSSRVPDKIIKLRKNESYWNPQIPKINKLQFVIIDEEKWVDALITGKVDLIPNLAGNQTTKLMKKAKGKAKILKRLVLAGYWVLIKNRGALADLRVRKAMNYGIDKKALVRIADFNNAKPLASLGKVGEFGYNEDLSPYPYDLQKAKKLLTEAGFKKGIRLKGIVSDVAKRVGKIIRYNLSLIDIDLDLEIVSRVEWAEKVVGFKIKNGIPAPYDIAINLVDNPIHNLAFHAGLFLSSDSPWSLLNSPEFDRKYQETMRVNNRELHEKKLRALDRYIYDNALMLFTTQRVMTVASRRELKIKKVPLNGHVDYLFLTTASFR